RTEKPPVLDRVHLRALCLESVDELHRQLLRVRIAEHIPLPHHAAHARELDAHRLEPAAPPLLEALLAISEFTPQLGVGGLRQARVGPMAVREQNAGRLASGILRTIEVARHEEARTAFKISLLHAVIAAIDF